MIRVEQLRKAWPGFLLEIEDLEIAKGEYFVVLGPSGAGKTVLLSCLAGIVRPDSGRIWLEGRDVAALPPERRHIGWVSQSNTLFPHLTVERNILFSRRYASVAREEFDRAAARLVEMLNLGRLLERSPSDLSGGEVQRVMLARALAREPRLLLLDEPLRGLDPTTQERLREELVNIHRRLRTTTVHITHDHVEARALADRIAVLRDGRIEQVGTGEEVFERPATCFVARFTGAENVFRLADEASGAAGGEMQAIARRLLAPHAGASQATHLSVRPEHVELWSDEQAERRDRPGWLRLAGTVELSAKHGAWLRVSVRCDAVHWVALVDPRQARGGAIAPGRKVTLYVAPEHIHFIRDEGAITEPEQ